MVVSKNNIIINSTKENLEQSIYNAENKMTLQQKLALLQNLSMMVQSIDEAYDIYFKTYHDKKMDDEFIS